MYCLELSFRPGEYVLTLLKNARVLISKYKLPARPIRYFDVGTNRYIVGKRIINILSMPSRYLFHQTNWYVTDICNM